MAFYNVTSFWYDEATGNIFVHLVKDVDVSYDHLPEESAQDIYEAQIFLDGGLNLIGKSRPSSTDGTIQGGMYGRGAGSPETPPAQPLESAPS
ncbi:hypothetical protein PP459_gp118 [Streptomyces phage Wakanda]|uniref:Uncharacterized protein n=1 Tax=Streptomyces phage Wakanda TaxID=2713267 RepID=A0A6G8R1N2_9CAUD|nr:hypothetical protein PP459_gp118 [Streptomyces phage Wakanda]QIN94115.1 hypothetical protein SEA_WAKANDA_148 [Streptomyces phage Wakanda]